MKNQKENEKNKTRESIEEERKREKQCAGKYRM